MSETGSIKFTCQRVATEPVAFRGLAELNACRRKLLQLRVLGMGADGIGFGNLSVRDSGTNNFYITGSGTGGLRELGPEHCARVVDYDFNRNWLRCEGDTVASSESLTHAAIYKADANVAAVIHCHSAGLWKRLRGVVPTTLPEIDYGTPEMAYEVQRLLEQTDVEKRKIFVMAGHEDGVVAFGDKLEEAFGILLRHGPVGPSS